MDAWHTPQPVPTSFLLQGLVSLRADQWKEWPSKRYIRDTLFLTRLAYRHSLELGHASIRWPPKVRLNAPAC